MYNYYQPQNNLRQSVVPQVGLKGRPVSSLEEVKAASIDFDGSIFFFPDLANKRIFTKQINMDGTSSLYMYELKEFPIAEGSSNYVTREEFSAAMSQIQEALQVKIPSEKGKGDNYEF